MSAPLLISDRPRPRTTQQPLNVSCLIYEPFDRSAEMLRISVR